MISGSFLVISTHFDFLFDILYLVMAHKKTHTYKITAQKINKTKVYKQKT